MQYIPTRSGAALDLYQAYFGEAQRQQIAPIAIPYDVAGNTANDQREYELFRRIFSERSPDAGPWGLVSSKFELKTMVPLEEFQRFAVQKLASGFDCVFINPMIGNEAMHLNVWEQWWVANEDVKVVCNFLEGVDPIHSGMQMGRDDFCFCNYFVGSNRFWTAYFDYVEQFSRALERERQLGSPMGQFYAGSGNYERNLDITTRPFIIERLFSSFLSTHPEISRAPYVLPEAIYHAKFGARLGETLYYLSTLKNRAIDASDQTLFTEWSSLRGELFPQAMQVIWPLDDPIDLVMAPRFRPSLAAARPTALAG